MSQIGKLKTVRPILSRTFEEARHKVLLLYKAWYRQVPYIIKEYDIPATEKMFYDKIRDEFLKQKNVKDIRIIDLLIFRGQNELRETALIWKQRTHVMHYFSKDETKISSDFLNNFLTKK